MSYIFGTSNQNNYFGSFFNNTSSKNDNISSFFGASNNMLGDYSLIKSGAYKKLLTAYYKNVEGVGENSTTDKANSKENSVETGKLISAKTDASELKEAVDKLGDASLYEATGKDENGNNVYNTDGIKSTVKDFVKKYNDFLDSTSEVDNVSVLNKSLSMVKKTASNQKLLKSVGITIGEDNKLVLDEEKLASAHMSTLTSLFTGRYSYGDTVSQKAAETYKAANSAVYASTGASSYTYKGDYSIMGTANSSMDKYF